MVECQRPKVIVLLEYSDVRATQEILGIFKGFETSHFQKSLLSFSTHKVIWYGESEAGHM